MPQANTKYDAGKRRRATRAGRQKGCSVYVPAEELRKAGYDPDGPLPFYRTWGTKGGRVIINLYPEP